MILIIGSNRDDVLYFENLVKDAHEEVILKRYHATIGTIANQNVIVLQDVYTSMVSSMLTSYIIDKYLVLMVFVVGRCEALSSFLTYGDVAVSDNVVFGDVDMVARVKGSELGQIPGYPTVLPVNTALLNNMNNALENVIGSNHYNSTFISSSFFRMNKEAIPLARNNGRIAALNKHVVLDGETGGVALACIEHDIPFISVKVVEAIAGEYTSLDNYIMVLDKFALVGKAIARCIEEIHRQDVIRL